MARVLVTPTITASPAQGGTVSFVPGATGSYPMTADNAYRFYSYMATPAQGYAFSWFDVSVTSVRNGATLTNTWRRMGVENAGTWTYDAADPGGFGYAYMGYAFWLEDLQAPDVIQVTDISVTAVFAPVRVPTHLLVNSSTIESPASLVYDPATDLLVADY